VTPPKPRISDKEDAKGSSVGAKSGITATKSGDTTDKALSTPKRILPKNYDNTDAKLGVSSRSGSAKFTSKQTPLSTITDQLASFSSPSGSPALKTQPSLPSASPTKTIKTPTNQYKQPPSSTSNQNRQSMSLTTNHKPGTTSAAQDQSKEEVRPSKSKNIMPQSEQKPKLSKVLSEHVNGGGLVKETKDVTGNGTTVDSKEKTSVNGVKSRVEAEHRQGIISASQFDQTSVYPKLKADKLVDESTVKFDKSNATSTDKSEKARTVSKAKMDKSDIISKEKRDKSESKNKKEKIEKKKEKSMIKTNKSDNDTKNLENGAKMNDRPDLSDDKQLEMAVCSEHGDEKMTPADTAIVSEMSSNMPTTDTINLSDTNETNIILAKKAEVDLVLSSQEKAVILEDKTLKTSKNIGANSQSVTSPNQNKSAAQSTVTPRDVTTKNSASHAPRPPHKMVPSLSTPHKAPPTGLGPLKTFTPIPLSAAQSAVSSPRNVKSSHTPLVAAPKLSSTYVNMSPMATIPSVNAHSSSAKHKNESAESSSRRSTSVPAKNVRSKLPAQLPVGLSAVAQSESLKSSSSTPPLQKSASVASHKQETHVNGKEEGDKNSGKSSKKNGKVI